MLSPKASNLGIPAHYKVDFERWLVRALLFQPLPYLVHWDAGRVYESCAATCYPPPNSCSWVRDAVVLPITVGLLSCVGGRAFMIAPNRDNGNGFRASDCKIAEDNIFSTLLFFTILFFVDCFAGNTRKCCFQCISARICVQNGISAPVILFFVVFWDNCARCLA